MYSVLFILRYQTCILKPPFHIYPSITNTVFNNLLTLKELFMDSNKLLVLKTQVKDLSEMFKVETNVCLKTDIYNAFLNLLSKFE